MASTSLDDLVAPEGAARPEAVARPVPSWALSPGHVALVALWGLLFMVFNNLPLARGALWGHVLYGEWILEHRALPDEDPLMPLAAGVEILDTPWLAQVVLAAVENAGGVEWLSHLFALTVLLTYLFVARACFLVSASVWWSALGTGAALLLAGSRATSLRPETFGALCFAVLLWLVAGGGALDRDPEPHPRRGARWRLWLGVPLLFVVWANLHGSFLYGLALLGCCFLGRALEVGWRERGLRAALLDGATRRWLYLAELALAATLINPFGLDLLLDGLGFQVTANPRAQAGGVLVAIHGGPGLLLIVSWLAVAVLLARTRRLSPAQLVPWLGFAAIAVTGVQKLTWYAPVFGLTLAVLVAGTRSSKAAEPAGEPRGSDPRGDERRPGCMGRSVLATLLAVLVAFGAFTFSPLGAGLFIGLSRPASQVLGPGAPLALTGWLQANPPRGQVFNSQTWGDWLVYEGPPGIQPFVTSWTAHVPIRVWLDYQRAIQAGYEWQRIFERYRVDTVVLDAVAQRVLSRALRFTDGWSQAYDDGQAVVYVRNHGRGGSAASGAGGTPSSAPVSDREEGS